MTTNEYVVAAIGEWNKELFNEKIKQFDGRWHYVSTPNELNEILQKVEPEYIFFLHWRWLVPKKIIDKHECICFHMTDVPFGRGGSPLQNLIVRGYKETILTVLKMEEGLDTGAVYFKESLSLEGTAKQIYLRAADLSWKMINNFFTQKTKPKPIPQVGQVTLFKRRMPEDSRIPPDLTLDQLYDYIRMLDAPDYPKAFMEHENYRLEFENASLNKNEITAYVKIFIRNKDETYNN